MPPILDASDLRAAFDPLRTPPAGRIKELFARQQGDKVDGADLVERAVSAFNAHDAAAFAAVFADDGVMIEYPDRIAGRGRDAIREYIGGMFAAFPAAKVELVGRIDLGNRQITHERFERGDGSPPYEAGLVYNISEGGIERMDFVRELREI